MTYKNKNIWIIGASSGIGEELYLQLAAAGANLIISARNEERLKEIIGENKNHFTNSFSLGMDIIDENSITNAVQKIQEKWQKIDLIIFCAGVYEPMSVDNFDLAKAKNILEINFVGFLNFFDKILPLIKTNKINHLAIISSVASYFGMNNSICYGASKAGLSNLVESLYLELKKYGVKVQLINPGFVKTRLTAQNKFKMPFIIEPSQAAQIIIDNLSKNKFEIFFPKIFVWVMKFIRFLPYQIQMKILSKVK